jgi:hypothetical protein
MIGRRTPYYGFVPSVRALILVHRPAVLSARAHKRHHRCLRCLQLDIVVR